MSFVFVSKPRFFLSLMLFLVLGVFAVQAQPLSLNQKVPVLLQALEKDPNNAKVKAELAYLYAQGMEYKRAAEIYQSLLGREEINQDMLLTELCFLHTSLREKDKALSYCGDLAKRHPQDALLMDNLGLSHFKFADFQGALPYFLKALSLNPNSGLIRYHVAQVFLAFQENQAARTWLKNTLEIKGLPDQEQVLAFHGLYQVNLLLKNYDEALQAAWQAYQLSQNGLYLGKTIYAGIKAYQVLVYFIVSAVLLWFCYYFGERVNRFLKNE
ncbi:MAG: hypothetical protein H7A33_02405 [Deltaproteobacteria bacterium]|nr:hypothetical protein [Deltaproteobacteria bacterium]